MSSLAGLLINLLNIFLLLLVARAVLSWFPGRGGSIGKVVHTATEPVLGPVRRALPPMGAGGMQIDLSFLVVFLLIRLLVMPILYGLV